MDKLKVLVEFNDAPDQIITLNTDIIQNDLENDWDGFAGEIEAMLEIEVGEDLWNRFCHWEII